MPGRGLTIGDYTVLGIVDRDGPCTAYSVMIEMASSPSSFYRKRASTTYAVIQKLLQLGLITTDDEEPGPRGERPVTISAEGRKVLHAWLCSVPEHEAKHSNDLVRLRINFLKSLPPMSRKRLLDRSKEILQAYLKECEGELPKREDPLRQLTLIGLIHETRARIAWLEEVDMRLDDLDAQTANAGARPHLG